MTYFQIKKEVIDNIPSEFLGFVNSINNVVEKVDQLFLLQISKEDGVYISSQIKSLTKDRVDKFSVSRVVSKKQKEIPYSIYYSKQIKEIILLLEEVLREIDKIKSKEFTKKWWTDYINITIDGFKKNKWQEVGNFFLSSPEDNLFILHIGPTERYHDKQFGVKRFFSAWFLIQDSSQQQKYLPFWHKLEEVSSKKDYYLNFGEKNDFKAKLFIGNTISKGGEVSKLKATGWSRPEQIEVAKKYGSIKTIAINEYLVKLVAMQQEIKDHRGWTVNKEDEKKINSFIKDYPLLSLLLHEYGHTFIKPNNAASYLGEYYTFIEEARAEANMLFLSKCLEEIGYLEKGITKYLFLSEILLFHFYYQEFINFKQRSEYLYSNVFWIYKSLTYEFLSMEKRLIKVNTVNSEQLFSLIQEMYVFFNSIAYFSKDSNPYLKKYKMFISNLTTSYAEKLFK